MSSLFETSTQYQCCQPKFFTSLNCILTTYIYIHFTVYFYCERHDPAAATAPLAYDEVDAVFTDEATNGAEAAQMEVDDTQNNESA